MDTAGTKNNYLTVDTVGKMSTYELRQEADKRGLLQKMTTVNHAALLRRLVQASTYLLIIGLSRYSSGRTAGKDCPHERLLLLILSFYR